MSAAQWIFQQTQTISAINRKSVLGLSAQLDAISSLRRDR
jgi:hypothetical protein